MILLGITGGIGMGKSTSADLLAGWGYPVVDTDRVAREVAEPGTPGLAEIREAFGPSALNPDGTLDRSWMAQKVFTDPVARGRLESILHPRIRTEWERRVAGWRKEDRALGVVVIPLLFETHAESAFDATLCVACSASAQRERLRRRGWTEDHITHRIAAQMPVEDKMRKSSFVVWTDPPLPEHETQLRRILARWGLTP